MESESFKAVFRQSTTLQSLDPAQVNALMELLVAATFVDNEVTRVERQALVSAMESLPRFDEQHWASLEGDDGLTRITKIGLRYMNPDRRDEFLDGTVAHFAEPREARAVFDAVVAILHCDGLDGAEFEFCMEVGARLGLDRETIHSIVAEAWAVA